MLYKFFTKRFNEQASKIIRKNIVKENYTIVHGQYRHDSYNIIKTDPYETERIIQRENEIFKKWKKMFSPYFKIWEKSAFSKTLISTEEIGEEFGKFIYYNVSTNSGYDILRRKNENSDQLVLDIKTIPFIKDINTTNLKAMRISHDHKFVSFIVDLENNEKYYGGIYDIENEIYYKKVFKNASLIEFTIEEDYVLYLNNNELNRPYQIVKHKLNWQNNDNKEETDDIIFEEADSNVYIETNPTKDSKFLIINSLTKEDSKISIINLRNNNKIRDDYKPEIITLFKRQKGSKYFIDHTDDSFYILSNLIVESNSHPEIGKNRDYKMFLLRDNQIDNVQNNLKLLIFPEEEEYFEDMDIFKDHVVIYYKKILQPFVLIHNVHTKLNLRLKVGDAVGEFNPGLNKLYETNKLNVKYNNPTNYNTIFEFDLKTGQSVILKEGKIKNVNPKNFEIIETFAPAKDGEKIPLTLMHKKGISLNRKNKTLLMGYGAYGLNMELTFDHALLTAAENGWVIAYAHLRGGYEKGRTWHDLGKLENKPMVIEDYLACAYELIQNGYSHPNYLAGYGQSAGGAVVAQAINLKPELFRAVILSHPFLDILSTLLDDSLPLTIPDYEEYGNPLTNENIYFTIQSYSPYENISNKEYPAILISMSLDDPRVPSWGTLKYIEKLRKKAKEPTRLPNFLEKNICVKIDASGHFGAINPEEALKEKIWELMWCDKMLIEKDNILL